MGDVQFDQDNANEFGAPPTVSSDSGMTAMLIKWGLVSTEQEAQYVLIGVAVVALVLAFFLVKSAFF
jgi:phosphate starvation-inducible membrane PsiE